MASCHIGADIGSTTVKVVVLNEKKEILFKRYQRHHSKSREAARMLGEAAALWEARPRPWRFPAPPR